MKSSIGPHAIRVYRQMGMEASNAGLGDMSQGITYEQVSSVNRHKSRASK